MNVIQIGSWVIHSPAPKGAKSKQPHLASGRVFLTGPVGASSYSVLSSRTGSVSAVATADNNH